MTVEITIKDEDIRQLIAEALGLPAYTVEATAPARCEWIPASEPPKEDRKVVVKTKDGAVYFETPRNGKLMKNVEFWYPLPDDDAIKKGAHYGKS